MKQALRIKQASRGHRRDLPHPLRQDGWLTWTPAGQGRAIGLWLEIPPQSSLFLVSGQECSGHRKMVRRSLTKRNFFQPSERDLCQVKFVVTNWVSPHSTALGEFSFDPDSFQGG